MQHLKHFLKLEQSAQEVMLRRLKREVMAQLPPKRRQVVRLPPPAPADWPRADGGKEAPDTASSDSDREAGRPAKRRGCAAQATAQPMSASHRMAIAKLPSVLRWLVNALGGADDDAAGGSQGGGSQAGGSADGGPHERAPAPGAEDVGPKFIVFAHHRTVMAKLAAALDGAGAGRRWAGVPFVFIDGSTDAVDRRAACRRFRDDPAVRVALLSITAAGTGLDFSAASAVVFAELPDEVALVRQAEDRAHRHGQRRAVNVYFLLARGTSDERRWQLLDRSLERVTAVHDGGGAAGGSPGDARGIALDAVCEAGGARGWGGAVACKAGSGLGPGLASGPGSGLESGSFDACAALMPSGGAAAAASPHAPGAKASQDPFAEPDVVELAAAEPDPARARGNSAELACVGAGGVAERKSAADPLAPVHLGSAAVTADRSLSASSSAARLLQADGLVDDEAEWVSDEGEESPGCGRPSAARSRVPADPVTSLGSGPHAAAGSQPAACQAGDPASMRATDGLASLRGRGAGMKPCGFLAEDAPSGAVGAAQSAALVSAPCGSSSSEPSALAGTPGDGAGVGAACAAGGGAALPDVAGASEEERPKVSQPMPMPCNPWQSKQPTKTRPREA